MSGALPYLLRRAGFYLLAAWVAITMNFVVPRLMPGDPATVMFARFKGQLEPQALDALRQAFGLTDAPLWRQYLTYLGHVLQGELGTSVAYFPEPVSAVLWDGMVWTLFLAGVSVVLAFGLGTTLGALAAWRRGGVLDRFVPPALALLGAFPYFWMAMVVLAVLGYGLELFPTRHAYGPDVVPGWNLAFFVSVIQHAALPGLTLVLASLGGWVLGMRNTMVAVLGSDTITFARARGLAPRRILLHYAARNALLPSLTSFGMALGFVISGTLLTEIIFSYPGQGYLLIQAVRAQDYPLMQGLFLAITLAVLAANWLVDVVTVALDPRTRR